MRPEGHLGDLNGLGVVVDRSDDAVYGFRIVNHRVSWCLTLTIGLLICMYSTAVKSFVATYCIPKIVSHDAGLARPGMLEAHYWM